MTEALKLLDRDIEKTRDKLRRAYDLNMSTRTYRRHLKTLIELTEAKTRLEFNMNKENN